MICELCWRLQGISNWPNADYAYTPQRECIRDILAIMVPWVQNLLLGSGSDLDISQKAQSFSGSIIASQMNANVFLNPSLRGNRSLIRSETILNNFLYLTIDFGDQLLSEIENLWSQLISSSSSIESSVYESVEHADARSSKHLELVVDYLLSIGISTRNPKFVGYAKKIIISMGRSNALDLLVESLVRR